MPDPASFSPSGGEGRGFLSIGTLARVGRALIKDHRDVRTEGGLNLHAFFRGKQGGRAIEVVLKLNPLLGDLACLGEGPDLESSRVGENRAIPAGEAMKSSEFTDRLLSRSEPEVIGIAENDFRAQKLKFVRVKGLDGSLSAYGHEYGGLNCAMSSGKTAVSGLGGRVGGKKLEHYGGEVAFR